MVGVIIATALSIPSGIRLTVDVYEASQISIRCAISIRFSRLDDGFTGRAPVQYPNWISAMATHAVPLRIVPSIEIECKFWFQGGVWHGTAEPLAITVQASSFEQVKSQMASALGKHLENLLRGNAANAQAA
jgi:hypothetical protein